MIRRCSLLALLVNFGCATTLPLPEFERFDMTATPTAEAYPDAAAVILLDRAEISLAVDGRTGNPIARLRRLRRTKILRESGLELAQTIIPYVPGSAIHGLSVRSVSEDGAIRVADAANIADAPFNGMVRAKTLYATNVRVGSVVETTYDQYIEDPRFLPAWHFQSDLPTVRSELTVNVPPGFSVDLRFSQAGKFVDKPPERFDTPGGTRYSWSLSNLPALYVEPNMPAQRTQSPRAHIVFLSAKIRGRDYTGFRSWDDVATWFVNRVPNWAEVSDATRGEAQRVAGDAPNLEKAVKIMEVLARDLEDEPDAAPPLWRAPLFHPDAVLRKKSANPTSRGLLLVSLLRAVGLDAVIGLYTYRDQDSILPDLPTIGALSGVCAVIPQAGGPIVLDPSQPLVDPRVAAPRLQGTRVVALMQDGPQVLRVPQSAPEDSLTEIRFDLRLDPRGDIFGPLKATLTGAEAGALRQALLQIEPEAYAETVSQFLRARGVGFDVQSVSIADLKAFRRPLTISANINEHGFLPAEGTEIAITLAKIIGSNLSTPPEVRRAPLILGPPSRVELQATLTLPEEFETGALPAASTVQWQGGQVELTVRSETRRRIGFVRTQVHNGMDAGLRTYRAYRRYREELEIAEDDALIIRRPPPRRLEY